MRWCRAAVLSLWSSACRKARLCLWTGGWGSAPRSPAPPPHTRPQPPGPSSPTSGKWDRHSQSLWAGSPSHTASSSAAGSRWAPKRSQSAGGGVEEGKGGQPGLHPHRPRPHLSLPNPQPPSAPCPGPHRCPRGEDTVEHVTSKSHADHQISGIAGRRATGGGSREPHALVTHPGLPPHIHSDSPGTGPHSL